MSEDAAIRRALRRELAHLEEARARITALLARLADLGSAGEGLEAWHDRVETRFGQANAWRTNNVDPKLASLEGRVAALEERPIRGARA